MTSQQSYYDFLTEYIGFLTQMEEAQKVQLEAVLSKQVGLVEKSIAVLQTSLMKLDNMEKKRIELQAEAGFGDMTFRQIIDTLPEDSKQDYKKLFDEMEKRVSDISYYNSKSQDKVKLDLKIIGSDKVNDGTQSATGVYNANKKSAGTHRSLFESKA